MGTVTTESTAQNNHFTFPDHLLTRQNDFAESLTCPWTWSLKPIDWEPTYIGTQDGQSYCDVAPLGAFPN